MLLGDFGQAMREDNLEIAREYMVGDPKWSPPEYPDYAHASDVWGVGAVMQATCAMQSLKSFTGSQAVYGACRPYSKELNGVILPMMYEWPWDRRDIMDIAKEVGRQWRIWAVAL